MGAEGNEKEINVTPCRYRDVARFRSRAAREATAIQDSRATQWFCAMVESEVVGCGAVMRRGSVFRIKAQYVVPEHRGLGVGAALLARCLEYCEENLASMVETFAHKPGTYERLGFHRTGRRLPNGAAHLVRYL